MMIKYGYDDIGTLYYAYSVPSTTLQGKSMDDDEYDGNILPPDPQQLPL